MKRMFSKEEIEKIVEAVGGGLTPEEVEDIIASYLEENPPVSIKYVHNIFLERSPNYHVMVTIVTNDPDMFTKESFANFLNSLSTGAKLMATGYIPSGSATAVVFAIGKSSTTQFTLHSQGGGTQAFLYSDITSFSDIVFEC